MIVTDEFFTACPFDTYCGKQRFGFNFKSAPGIDSDVTCRNEAFDALASNQQAAYFLIR